MDEPIEVDHGVPKRANEAKQAPKAQRTAMPPLEVSQVGVTKQSLQALADRAAAKLREVGDAHRPAPAAKDTVWYLACGCAKDMPACVFTEKPDLSQNKVASDKWFASYKAKDAEWDEGREPLCQVCYAEKIPGPNGKLVPKKVSCRLRPRFVRSCSEAEFEDRMLPRELRKAEGVTTDG